MKIVEHLALMILGTIIQIILIVPIFLFIWRFIIRKILHPNPIQKYKQKDSYAIVTGASEGIGKAYAERLAKEGFNLILIARRKQLLEEIKQKLTKEYQIDVILLNYDMCNMTEEQWNEIDKLMKEKNISVLINNVSYACSDMYHKFSVSDIDRMVKLNIEITLDITHRFINHVSNDKKYFILFMSSCSSVNISPFNAVYSATKAFIKQFGKSISYEYQNIDCTTIVPWHISTEMIGNIPTNIGVCTPKQLVDSAFIHVGLTNEIDPYIPHYLQDWFYDRIPDNIKGSLASNEFKSSEDTKYKNE